MKYRVECGSLVTVLRKRTYTITADTKEEATEKARKKFIDDCYKAKRYIDVGGTVEIDDIRTVE